MALTTTAGHAPTYHLNRLTCLEYVCIALQDIYIWHLVVRLTFQRGKRQSNSRVYTANRKNKNIGPR